MRFEGKLTEQLTDIMVDVNNLNVVFDKNHIIHDVSFKVKKGEIIGSSTIYSDSLHYNEYYDFLYIALTIIILTTIAKFLNSTRFFFILRLSSDN